MAARPPRTMNLVPLWHNGRSVVNARWALRDADSVGAKVRLAGRLRVVNDGRMVIGDRVQIFSTIATTEFVTGPDGTLEIGERSFVNSGCAFGATLLVRIGANCQIGPHTMIMDNDFHRIEPERRLERPESKPVILEDNVWIGARAILLPGVTVGAGSCIGAGSVVTRDVPPRTFAAGVPARFVSEL
jgi:acetyltransferase-like isoleucine patch superfamily enzyme